MSGSGLDALPDVKECLGGPPGCPGVFGMTSQMSGSDRKALPYVREWSQGLTECPGVVMRPSRSIGRLV